MSRHPLVQSVALIAAALVLAVVANGFASRQRRLVLPGFYPNAQRIPQRVAPTPAPLTETVAPTAAVATATTATTTPVLPPVEEMPTETSTVTSERPSESKPIVAPAIDPRQTAMAAPAAPVAPPSAKPAVDPLARFKPHPDQPWVEISGDDAMLLHKNGVLFLDARRTSVFEEGHIAGAKSYSVWESDVDDKVNQLFSERSDPEEQNRPIVIYCSGGACEDSHMLAQKLWGIQFNNVYVYKDGFPDWQKRRGAVKTGAQP